MAVIDLDKGGRQQQIQKVWLGPSIGYIQADQPASIEWAIEAQASIQTGFKGTLIVPQWLIITSWMIFADQSGSIQIDVWKISSADYLAGTLPTVANTITGTDIPKITSGVAASSALLTGWTLEIKQNDVLAFNVDSASAISKATLVINAVKIIGQYSGVGES